MQFYTDQSKESDLYSLPNAEVWFEDGTEENVSGLEKGYYWWLCFPGCLADSDPIGPFDSEEEAVKDAREQEE